MSTVFHCTPARKNLNHQTENEVYAIFSFKPPAIEGASRAPIDVTVAMDVSGSMGGQKIEMAKASLAKLVEHLTDRDRLGIVAFSTEVEVVLKPTRMDPAGKRDAQHRIGGMRALSSTNLSGGVLQALALLKEGGAGKDTVRRCLTFTDGRANVGIRNADELAATVLEFRDRIGISAFGYGIDHDPVLLNRLSQDGGFYYIDNPDKILTAFGQELGGLISTYAQNVELRLKPAEGVEVIEVLNDLTVTNEDGTAVIRCDDLLAEQPYHVIVKLKIGKRDNVFPRDVSIVHATTKFFDLVAKKPAEETAALKVRFVKPGEEDTKDATEVAEEVALQMIGKAAREADKLAAAGDLRGAQDVFVAAAAYSGDIGNERGDALGLMARGLQVEAFGNAEKYRLGGSHTANAVAKGITRRRAAGLDNVGGVNFDAMYGSKSQAESAKAFEDAKNAGPNPPDPAGVGTQTPPEKANPSSFEKRRSQWR